MPTTTYAETYDDVGLMGGEDVQAWFFIFFGKKTLGTFWKTLIGWHVRFLWHNSIGRLWWLGRGSRCTIIRWTNNSTVLCRAKRFCTSKRQFVTKVSVQPHFNQVHEEVKHEVQEVKEDPEEIALRQEEEHYMKQKPPITISNVVCNYRCRTHLNLRDIALSTKHVIYKRFLYRARFQDYCWNSR